MTTIAEARLGDTVMERLTALARLSEDPTCLTRRFLSDAHKAAAAQVQGWMEEAGMAASVDAVGNVVGRYESEPAGRPALLIGSHIDTVINAGWYDGNLGVVGAIACVGELARQGRRLPFAIEVIAFGDEEGSRFPTTLTGSRAVAGRFDPAALDATDEAGVSVREALEAFGCDPSQADRIGRTRDQVHAYVELHIEQGPVLEAEGLPVGVVTAINGASRFEITLAGMAGHAGTVPMALRRDALAGAAEMIAAVEEIGGASPGLVATVGVIEALPGAVNVVPGDCRFTLDVRAPEDDMRAEAVAAIDARLHEIAGRRGLDLTIKRTHDAPAAVCAPWIMDQFDAAVERHGIKPFRLPSGAGHDAMAFSGFCPIGMLFMRCEAGISHNPVESVTTEDTDIAVRVLLDFIERFEPHG
ncbi:MAG: allantoate amidohydrolase [Alphaproteobacteria bacterium]|nr:allantoate amidohydrolase [Alphaproteobacteria bacterium]